MQLFSATQAIIHDNQYNFRQGDTNNFFYCWNNNLTKDKISSKFLSHFSCLFYLRYLDFFRRHTFMTPAKKQQQQKKKRQTMREKCPNTEFFLVHIFSHSDWTRRDTPYLSVFSLNAGNCGPEKTPYLDTFQAVLFCDLPTCPSSQKPIYCLKTIEPANIWQISPLPRLTSSMWT